LEINGNIMEGGEQIVDKEGMMLILNMTKKSLMGGGSHGYERSLSGKDRGAIAGMDRQD
jgi:hypothetical protein